MPSGTVDRQQYHIEYFKAMVRTTVTATPRINCIGASQYLAAGKSIGVGTAVEGVESEVTRLAARALCANTRKTNTKNGHDGTRQA